MTISSTWDLASDAEIITAVRSGDSAAFGVLYERHAGAARAVARQYSNSAADAEDAVSDAFSRVFSAIQGGGGPDVAFRAYLFTVLRRVALDRIELARRAAPTDDLGTFEDAVGPEASTEEPTMAGFERGVVSKAYKSLPERWQAVLWYTEVEELTPAQIAPVLGLTANGVAALAYRAREGLRQAYLQQHLASPQSEACTIVNAKLGAYVRGGLARRETALVESHLEECGTCRALVLELGDVNHGMRVVIAPLVLGGVAVSVLHGLGFGGAAGAAAGAAAGGAGAGTGAAAGSAPAAGTVGGGASAAGTAGGGAGAGAAGAGAAGAGAGAGSLGVGAGVGSAVASGAAAATGGLAALVASAPAAVGLVVAGVVVAGAVATATLTGVFDAPPASEVAAASTTPTGQPSELPTGGSTDDPSVPSTPVPDPSVTEPAPTPTEDLTSPTNLPDGLTDASTSTDDADAAPDTTDPTDDPSVPPADPGTDDPGTDDPDTPPTDPGTDDPDTDDPGTDDPDTPTDPPAPVLVIEPVDEVAVESGRGAAVSLTVRNDSATPTGEVRVHLAFPAGVTGDVVAPDVAGRRGNALGGAATTAAVGSAAPAATLPGGWTCDPDDPSAWTCSVSGIPANGSTTLAAKIRLHAPAVDGTAAVDVAVTTEVVGTGTVVRSSLRMNVTSPAAALVVGEPTPVTVQGAVGADVSGTLTVPVGNRGGTTIRGLTATVTLPTLPAGVSVAAATDMLWTCDPVAAGLTCSLPTLPRPGGYAVAEAPLVLDVVATGADPEAGVGLLDATVAEELSVVVGAGQAGAGPLSVAAPIRVESAPADVRLGAATGADLRGQTSGPVAVPLGAAVRNRGATTAHDVAATVVLPALPPGVTVTGAGAWACTPGGSALRCVLPSLAPGAEEPLTLTATAAAPDLVAGKGLLDVDRSVTLTVGLDAGGDVVDVPLRIRSAPADLRATWEPVHRLVGTTPATTVVRVTNLGGTRALAAAEVVLPSGTVATDPAGEGWTCPQRPDGTTLCSASVTLQPGIGVTRQLTVNGIVPGRVGTALLAIAVRQDGAVRWEQQATVTFNAEPQGSPSLAVEQAQAQVRPDATGAVTFAVRSTGDADARAVRVAVVLPGQLQVVRDSQGRIAGLDPLWTCSVSDGGHRVLCRTDTLVPGASRVVDLPVEVSGNPPWGEVVVTAGAEGVPERQTRVPVTEVGAVEGMVEVEGLESRTLVRQETAVRYAVTNTGDVELGPVTITLRDGTPFRGARALSQGWTCRTSGWSDGNRLTCTAAAVPPGGTTLALRYTPYVAGATQFDADWTGPGGVSGSTAATVVATAS